MPVSMAKLRAWLGSWRHAGGTLAAKPGGTQQRIRPWRHPSGTRNLDLDGTQAASDESLAALGERVTARAIRAQDDRRELGKSLAALDDAIAAYEAALVIRNGTENSDV